MRTAVFYKPKDIKPVFSLTMEELSDIWRLIEEKNLQAEFTVAILPVKMVS